jgi:hypothetical protein
MEENDKIVLLKAFDLAIDANLAKTKLDAHGIPCFLTNENMAGIYPIPVSTHFEVRLMVFENDVLRANEILNDQPEENLSRCPHCRSSNVKFQITSSFASRINTLSVALLLGIIFPQKRTFQCEDCHREFDRPDNF